MGADYYALLQIPRSASTAEVRKAYRKHALQWHPEKHHDKRVEAEIHFQRLSEAYTVLSEASLRAIFDTFGEDGLKTGIPGTHNAWTFTQTANEVFASVFGSTNPHQVFGEEVTSSIQSVSGPSSVLSKPPAPVQGPAIQKTLECTLEELYNGATKKVTIQKKVLNLDGRTTRDTEKMLTIVVKKGWKNGTKVTFPKEGDEGPGIIPSDIEFVIKTTPHARFTRDGDDLHLTTRIGLLAALTGAIIDITTLDERVLHIPINDIVTPSYVKTVNDEGMPISSKPGTRGVLHIHFEIDFPTKLSVDQKAQLKQTLA